MSKVIVHETKVALGTNKWKPESMSSIKNVAKSTNNSKLMDAVLNVIKLCKKLNLNNNSDNDDNNVNNNICCKNTMKDELYSLLECSICRELYCNPVTLPCGHTFCDICVKMTSFYSPTNKCSLCRCPINEYNFKMNTILNNLAKKTFPIIYKERIKDVNDAENDFYKTLPIFCLKDILLPGETLTLCIYEPRYIKMITHAINKSKQFIYYSTELNKNNNNINNDNDSDIPKENDIAFLVDIIAFNPIRDSINVNIKVTHRIKISQCFNIPALPNIHITKYTKYTDEPILISSNNNNNNTNNDSNSELLITNKNILNSIRSTHNILDKFVNNIVLKLDKKHLLLIHKFCGPKCTLDLANFNSITKYSYHIASLIKFAYKFSYNTIKLNDNNINPFQHNIYLKQICGTTNTLNRLNILINIINSVSKWN